MIGKTEAQLTAEGVSYEVRVAAIRLFDWKPVLKTFEILGALRVSTVVNPEMLPVTSSIGNQYIVKTSEIRGVLRVSTVLHADDSKPVVVHREYLEYSG